ncbi:MAG: ferrochelatase [Bacteroidetes bacterium]|nr:MAG: ferrochelatase [Bacteroidota bacterium]
MKDRTKRAIVLMNLGSPDSTEVKDVKKYLDEFLMDKRVIDYPYLLRLLLVKGIIIPARVKNSAEAYHTIWTKDGSPLIIFTNQLRNSLQERTVDAVAIMMRYGPPTPDETFSALLKKIPDLEEVLLIPMYPHYAMSSYETAVLHARDSYRRNRFPFKLKFIKPFYNNDDYLNALAESMKPYLQQDYDHVLFSYHGIPERHILKTDRTHQHCLSSPDCCDIASKAHETCYRHQCFYTTKKVVQRAGIPEGKFSNSFQSRIGKKWLTPYTDIRLEEMPKEGIKKLLVVCPAFVSDCLETLEEIAIRGKETFMNAGGESYEMIPCMNVNSVWVECLAKWIRDYESGDSSMILNESILA